MSKQNWEEFDRSEFYDSEIVDFEEIERFWKLVNTDDLVTELRALGCGRGGTTSGYFDSGHGFEFVCSAADLSGDCHGIYFTINAVVPELLARASNRVQEWARHTTSDSEIIRRRLILLDFDPVRASGISSNESEHEAAIQRACQVSEWLFEKGISKDSTILADSGNGSHILVRCDLPNDDRTKELVKKTLEAIALQFSDNVVDVDLTTYNAARISKIYGTLSMKGDSTEDRPHRISKILVAPETLVPVERERLEGIAALAPKAIVKANPRQRNQAADLDLREWIEKSDLQVEMVKPWEGGEIWVLKQCPWNPAHTNSSAFIIKQANGAIAAGCHHNGCSGKRWHELRDVVEPGWRDLRNQKRKLDLPDELHLWQKRELQNYVSKKGHRHDKRK